MVCEYCDKPGDENEPLCDTCFQPCSGFIFIEIEGNMLYAEAKDGYGDWHDSDSVPINFCPMCGRDLRKVG